MPRTKEQNQEIRQQRMEAILKAAIKVYVEKGYAATEIGDVAEQAGIARGLVYYYYNDKLSLFKQLFIYMISRSKEHVKSQLEKEGPILTVLENYVKSMYVNVLEEPEGVKFFMRMVHDLHMIFTEEELCGLNWPVEFMEVLVEVLKKGMETSEIRNISPRLLAAQFWGAVSHGMAYMEKTSRSMRADGKKSDEILQSFDRDITDAVESCLAIVRLP